MKKAVKIVLTNDKNEFLLQLRDKNHSYPGFWSLFWGHIENGEQPATALVREIFEELHYKLTNFELIKKSIVPDFGEVYWFKWKIDVDVSKLILTEGDNLGFFTYQELNHLKITPESKNILDEFSF